MIGRYLSKLGALLNSSGQVQTAGIAPDAVQGGMKNRVINGAMMVDQRNNGGTLLPTSTYTLDRWIGLSYVASTPTAKFTVGRNYGSVTPPPGFKNYLGISVTTAYTSWATGDFFNLVQYIEGLNTADFDWGKSTAKTVALSFWVRGSVTGTYTVSLRNQDATRSYPATYVINATNTWEYKTIIIPGEQTGTWYTDNTRGVELNFDLGRHSSYETSSPNTWNTSGSVRVAGTVRLMDTLNATLFITGVQLETSTQATSFEYRHYSAESILCYRYFYYAVNQQLAGAQSVTSYCNWYFPVVMRATPTLTAVGSDYSGATPYFDKIYFYKNGTYAYIGAGSSVSAEL